MGASSDSPLCVVLWTGHELRTATLEEAYHAAHIPKAHAIILPNPPMAGQPIYLFDRRALEPSAVPPPATALPEVLPAAQEVRPPRRWRRPLARA